MKSGSKFFAFVLPFLLSISPLSEARAASATPVGMMSTAGTVRVNGVPVSATQALFSGDVVETEASSSGILQIAPDGVAQFTASAKASLARSGQAIALQLHNGYVAVRQGSLPVSVRARGGRISAERGNVFEVAQVKGNTFITAAKGNAVISEGGLASPQTVREGQTVQVAFLQPGSDPTAAQAADPPQAQTSADCEKECKDQCAQKGERNCDKKCKDQCKKQQKQRKGRGAAGAGGAAAGGAAAGGTQAVAAAVTAAAVAGAAAAVAIPVALAATSEAERKARIGVVVSPSSVSAVPK